MSLKAVYSPACVFWLKERHFPFKLEYSRGREGVSQGLSTLRPPPQEEVLVLFSLSWGSYPQTQPSRSDVICAF